MKEYSPAEARADELVKTGAVVDTDTDNMKDMPASD